MHISVILTTYERPRDLRLALAGYSLQDDPDFEHALAGLRALALRDEPVPRDHERACDGGDHRDHFPVQSTLLH